MTITGDSTTPADDVGRTINTLPRGRGRPRRRGRNLQRGKEMTFPIFVSK